MESGCPQSGCQGAQRLPVDRRHLCRRVSIPEHLIKLHGELVYNDGVTPVSGLLGGQGRIHVNPDHDLSNAVLGASTDLYFGKAKNIVLTPSVYYQITMESTVNRDDDELWAGMSLKYSF